MSLTFYQALAQECSAETFRAARAENEARRNSGVAWSAMGGSSYTPRTEAELHEAARARMQARAEFEVTPQGRFVLALTTIREKAKADFTLPLYSACCRALECASRGLEGELDHAEKCLTEIDLLGGDVAEARAALTEIAAPMLQAAE